MSLQHAEGAARPVIGPSEQILRHHVDPMSFWRWKDLGPFDALAPLRFHLTTMTVHPAELQTFCDTLPVSSR